MLKVPIKYYIVYGVLTVLYNDGTTKELYGYTTEEKNNELA